ncbi:MAG TPA: hypothetical protein PKV84_00305 [Candidatus Omnitrophota bacterium]|nr:hypothetical protein [Candidatus Omnitrophota bacterium]
MSHQKGSKGLSWKIKKYCRWFKLSAKRIRAAVEAELGGEIYGC